MTAENCYFYRDFYFFENRKNSLKSRIESSVVCTILYFLSDRKFIIFTIIILNNFNDNINDLNIISL